MTQASFRRPYWRSYFSARWLHIAFLAVYFVLSIFVMLHFLNNSLLGDRYYRASFDVMMKGQAWRPFVYRILVPKLTMGLTDITPQDWKQAAVAATRESLAGGWLHELSRSMPWLKITYSKGMIYQRLVCTAIIYACLCGYIAFLYKLANRLFAETPAIALFAPVFGLLTVSSFSWPFQYIYDIPVLFLSAACYYYLLTRQWRAYLLFFLLACLNKESSIFILIFFTFWHFPRLKPKPYMCLCLAQGFIYMLIKTLLIISFEHNPGAVLERHLNGILAADLFSTSHYNRIFLIATMFFFLTFRWEQKPLFLKYSFWVVPFMYIAYICFGNPGEYRVFFDIMPLLVLLGTHTLIACTGISDAQPFAQPADFQTEGEYDDAALD